MSVTERSFIVVLRGPSAAIFRQGEKLRLRGFPSAVGPVDLSIATRWLQVASGASVPGQLWIDVRGRGESLDTVLVPFGNAGLAVLPTLSLCANAAIAEPELELGFESTEGVAERQYFQTYVPPDSTVVHAQRHVNIEATVEVLMSLAAHPDSPRLRRAANQYRLALDSWRLGREALALSHLWMALEAISKARLRRECETVGCESRSELANHLGVPLRDLDAHVRKRLLLKDDSECYEKAKEASDGFEHGYLEFDQIIGHAQDVRHRMAGFVREGILDLLDLTEGTRETLFSDSFAKPLGYWPLVKYLRGALVGGAAGSLSAEGNEYPFMRWKPVVESTHYSDGGSLRVRCHESVTAELGEGVEFRPESLEVWRAE